MNEEELLKIPNKEKSYTEEDLLLFIYDLRKQNTELKDNWNKLKEWLKNQITSDKHCLDLVTHCLSIQDLIDEKENILDKLQEIEGGMNE